MNLPFTLDQLQVLEAIVRLGSFSAAASHLRRAPSAISYAIKSLESALDVELFDRSGRRAKLTPAGELVVAVVGDVLERSRWLENLGQEMKQGWEPELRVVLDGVLPLPPIMRAVKHFVSNSPTRIRLRVEYLSGVRRRFDQERAHLMLAAEPAGDSRLIGFPMPQIEMLLVAHKDHPLHTLPAPIDRAALSKHVELLVADSGDRNAAPPDQLACIGGPHLFEMSDFQSKREGLRAGIGFGFLPLHLADRDLARGVLVPIQFAEGNRYVLKPHILCRRDEPLGPGARGFLEKLRAEIESATIPSSEELSALRGKLRDGATPQTATTQDQLGESPT